MDGMEAEMEPRPGWPLAVLGWEGGAARAARQVDVGQVPIHAGGDRKMGSHVDAGVGVGLWVKAWMRPGGLL